MEEQVKELASAQALTYAAELRELYARERQGREAAEDALGRLESSYRTTVVALAATLELRDDQTGGHAERVTALGLEIAGSLAPELLADPQLEFGFLLHDLGKIGIPDAILLKEGPLDPFELEVMRGHAALGEQIVARIPYLSGLAREIVGAHHERWDGTGYPRGIAGDRIPLAARIFSVADAYDAMTNDRPYRQGMSDAEARAEILRGAGSQFDPVIAEAFFDTGPPE